MSKYIPKTKVALYLIADSREFLEAFLISADCPAFCKTVNPTNIIFKNSVYQILVIAFDCNNYNTNPLFKRITSLLSNQLTLGDLLSQYSLKIEFVVEISGINPIAPTPGTGFPLSFLLICQRLSASIKYRLKVKHHAVTDTFRGGVYMYIRGRHKNDDLDFAKITQLIGSEPTSIIKKGHSGYYRETIDFDSWDLSMTGDNIPLSESMNRMMATVKQPRIIGRYCSDNNLQIFIDLGLYGFTSKIVNFTITADFISFCVDLQTKWVEIDLMD